VGETGRRRRKEGRESWLVSVFRGCHFQMSKFGGPEGLGRGISTSSCSFCVDLSLVFCKMLFSSSIVIVVVVVAVAPPWPCVCAFVVLIAGGVRSRACFLFTAGLRSTRVTRIVRGPLVVAPTGYSRSPHESKQNTPRKAQNRLLLKFFRGLRIGDALESIGRVLFVKVSILPGMRNLAMSSWREMAKNRNLFQPNEKQMSKTFSSKRFILRMFY